VDYKWSETGTLVVPDLGQPLGSLFSGSGGFSASSSSTPSSPLLLSSASISIGGYVDGGGDGVNSNTLERKGGETCIG